MVTFSVLDFLLKTTLRGSMSSDAIRFWHWLLTSTDPIALAAAIGGSIVAITALIAKQFKARVLVGIGLAAFFTSLVLVYVIFNPVKDLVAGMHRAVVVKEFVNRLATVVRGEELTMDEVVIALGLPVEASDTQRCYSVAGMRACFETRGCGITTISNARISLVERVGSPRSPTEAFCFGECPSDGAVTEWFQAPSWPIRIDSLNLSFPGPNAFRLVDAYADDDNPASRGFCRFEQDWGPSFQSWEVICEENYPSVSGSLRYRQPLRFGHEGGSYVALRAEAMAGPADTPDLDIPTKDIARGQPLPAPVSGRLLPSHITVGFQPIPPDQC